MPAATRKVPETKKTRPTRLNSDLSWKQLKKTPLSTRNETKTRQSTSVLTQIKLKVGCANKNLTSVIYSNLFCRTSKLSLTIVCIRTMAKLADLFLVSHCSVACKYIVTSSERLDRHETGKLENISALCFPRRSIQHSQHNTCLLYTSPSPRDATLSRMPSSA